jgi:hypothetical protein
MISSRIHRIDRSLARSRIPVRHGVESLFAQTASTVETDSAADADSDSEADSERRRRRVKRSKVPQPPGIGISFKWSQIDVRNFLSWLVDQDPKTVRNASPKSILGYLL